MHGMFLTVLNNPRRSATNSASNKMCHFTTPRNSCHWREWKRAKLYYAKQLLQWWNLASRSAQPRIWDREYWDMTSCSIQCGGSWVGVWRCRPRTRWWGTQSEPFWPGQLSEEVRWQVCISYILGFSFILALKSETETDASFFNISTFNSKTNT